MAYNDAEAPPFTEALIVPCLFCTGVEIESTEDFVRLVGWVQLPVLPGTHERRIISRIVMPAAVARQFLRALERELHVDGH